MTKLGKMGVLAHPKRPKTYPVAEKIVQSLSAQGIQTWHYKTWETEQIIGELRDTDMVVAIGGDGAMLKAARICATYAVPVLGINMGRLGFLTEIAQPSEWEVYLKRLLADDYWVETRMMVVARLMRGEEIIAHGDALNDVVISGHGAGTMIQLDTYIDGDWATTYNSDALIVATPTGSTAYALAAGGPILPPDLSNILVLPTAPHLSMDRPIILSEGSRVAVRLSNDNRNDAIVVTDGSPLAPLEQDDVLYVSACDYSSHFVRMRERNYFYRSLLDRLEPRVNQSAPENMKTLAQIVGLPNAD